MNKILVPSSGPCQWRGLLGDPVKHWKRGRSAFETAVSWEAAQSATGRRGLPPEIATVLNTMDDLKDAELLLAIPEHKVELNGSRAPSQNDVWTLLKSKTGLKSMTVEAKAGETFDKTVTEWLKTDQDSGSRRERLRWLCEHLKSDDAQDRLGDLRYQLFHRTVSAIKEARRFGAEHAVMMVQAFPGADESLHDFERFGEWLGVPCASGQLVRIPRHREPALFLGWADCKCATDSEVASALGSQ